MYEGSRIKKGKRSRSNGNDCPFNQGQTETSERYLPRLTRVETSSNPISLDNTNGTNNSGPTNLIYYYPFLPKPEFWKAHLEMHSERGENSSTSSTTYRTDSNTSTALSSFNVDSSSDSTPSNQDSTELMQKAAQREPQERDEEFTQSLLKSVAKSLHFNAALSSQLLNWNDIAENMTKELHKNYNPLTLKEIWDNTYPNCKVARFGARKLVIIVKEFDLGDFVKERVDLQAQKGGIKKKRKVSKNPWSREEEQHLIEMQGEFGNRWTLIAERMRNGRSGTEVKNYWYNNSFCTRNL